MSETKRWLIGLCVTALIGIGGIWLKMKSDSTPKEPQEIVVRIDPGDVTTSAQGVADVVSRVKIGANPTDEEKTAARDSARQKAQRQAFEKKVAQIRATKKVDDQVAEQILAEDPADFFAEEPVLKSEEVVDGELVVEYEFRFDDSKLNDALKVVEEVKEQFKCDGNLGPDHPRHRVIVLYRDTAGAVVEPQSSAPSTGLREVERFLKEKGVEVLDAQTQKRFYEQVKEAAGRITAPSEMLDTAIEMNKQPCYYVFVSVEFAPQPGGSNTRIDSTLSVECQDPEGSFIGSASKSGVSSLSGTPNPNAVEAKASKSVRDLSVPVMRELWDSAGPTLAGR